MLVCLYRRTAAATPPLTRTLATSTHISVGGRSLLLLFFLLSFIEVTEKWLHFVLTHPSV